MNETAEKISKQSKGINMPTVWRCCIILTLFSLAVGVIIWAWPTPGTEFTWLIFYPVVIAASFYTGFYAGVAVTLLACLVNLFLLSLLLKTTFFNAILLYLNINRSLLDSSLAWLSMAVFVVSCCFISHYIAMMQRTKKALKQAEALSRARSDNEKLLKSIIDNAPNMLGYWDRDLRCRYANNVYSEWFGMPPENIIGMSFQQLTGEQLFRLNEQHIRKVLAGEPQRFERTLHKANGSVGHIIGHYIPDFANDGTVQGFAIQSSEVTELKHAEAKLKLAACVFDNTLDGVFITDVNGIILSVNPSFTAITGYSLVETVGQSPRILQSNRHDQAFYTGMWHQIVTKGAWSGEIWNRRKDGELYLQLMNISMVPDDDGKPASYVSVFSDITDLRRKDDHIKHLAFHDALTDLPNRTLLMDRINQKLLNANREQCSLTLMFLDLDGFKQVNDKFGHNVGDELLIEMAQRLLALVRQSDTVARVGGDEFIFIVNNPQNRNDINDVAKRILNSINQPITILGNELQIGVSIGIAMFPEDGDSAVDLIRNADTAMYRAKSSGKNKVCFYTSKE